MFAEIELLFTTHGYMLVLVGSFLEGILLAGLILPGALFVILGGFFASKNDFSITIVILLAWLGMILGDLGNYYLGRLATHNRFINTRIGKFVHSKKDSADKLISKYGVASIYYSHFIGYLRSVIGFTAGLTGFPFKKYAIAVFFASLLWSLLFSLAGFFLAKSTEDIQDLNSRVVILSVGLVLIVILIHVLKDYFYSKLKLPKNYLKGENKDI